MTACTPKDEKIMSDLERSKINPRFSKSKSVKEAANQGGNRSQSNKFQFGSYPITANMYEKQLEALELVNVVMGYQDIADTGYTKTEAKIVDPSTFTTTVSMNKAELKYETNMGSFKNSRTRTWDVTVKMDGNELVSLVATSGKAFNNLDRLNTTDYVNMNDESAEVALSVNEDGSYALKLTGEGSVSGRLNGKKAFEKYTFALNSKIAANELGKSDVVVASTTAVNTFIKDNNVRPYVVNAQASNVKYLLKGACNATLLEVDIKSGRFTNKLVMTENLVEVQPTQHSRFSSSTGACGQRPVMDLARYLSN